LLVRHFLQKSAKELGVEQKRLSDAAVKYLSTLEWSGNVRQLENVCHWLMVMAPGQNIDIADLPPELRGDSGMAVEGNWASMLAMEAENALNRGEQGIMERMTQDFERNAYRQGIATYRWPAHEAAQLLGIGRNTLTRKIHELGMGRNDGAKESAK